MQHLWQLLTLGLLLLIAGCSKPATHEPVFAKKEGKPALWKVTGPKGKTGTAYVFGTVHMLPAETKWQSGLLDTAIQASDALIIEVVGLEDSTATNVVFRALGASPDQPPLASRVPAHLRAKLMEAAEPVPGPVDALDRLESWAAALMIAANGNAGLGLEKSHGVEALLQLRFAAQDKPINGLETISQQFGFFDTLPESDQRRMLAEIARSAANVHSEYQKLLDDWLAGRVDALVESANAGLLASPILRAVLLDNRNRNWANQIATMIGKGQHPFVAVGAGHLGGAGGVPALLKAQGYSVERVQ